MFAKPELLAGERLVPTEINTQYGMRKEYDSGWIQPQPPNMAIQNQ